jgi:hypothetical protein
MHTNAFSLIFYTLVVPLVSSAILLFIRTFASRKRPGPDSLCEVAHDLIFLAIGTAGGASGNPTLHMRYPNYLIGILSIMLGGVLSSIVLMNFRKWGPKSPSLAAAVHLFVAALPLGATVAVIWVSA